MRASPSWNCSICTLENEGQVDFCACCGALHDGEEEKKSGRMEKRTKSEGWSCNACTFVNGSDFETQCEICGTLRTREPSHDMGGEWRLLPSGAYSHSTKYQQPPVDGVVDTLSILSLNVWFEPHWFRERVAEQRKMFARFEADVVCLQEVTVRYGGGGGWWWWHFYCMRMVDLTWPPLA